MADVQAVLFDADGVLQLAPDYLHASLVAAVGLPPEAREQCLNEIFAAEAPALTGASSFEAELPAALKRLGSRCQVEVVLDHWRTIEAHDGVLAVVADLRRAGVYCAIASNQEHNRARHMSEGLGYAARFDREFYSCHIGHAKPSAGYFETVLRLGGLDPARTLFIDDRADNVAAARACGLIAEQFVLWQADDGAAALAALLRQHGLPVGGAP